MSFISLWRLIAASLSLPHNGNVYVSKKHTNKIFELLENDDDEAVQILIDEGKAEKYSSDEFDEGFITYWEDVSNFDRTARLSIGIVKSSS